MNAFERELKVAFSLGSQPLWIRVAKYVVFLLLVYLLREVVAWYWILLVGGTGGMILHFYFRAKTKGWTQSYGAWHYERVFEPGE